MKKIILEATLLGSIAEPCPMWDPQTIIAELKNENESGFSFFSGPKRYVADRQNAMNDPSRKSVSQRVEWNGCI